MTRTEFIDRLRRGLAGLPPATVADFVADYEAHFSDAAEAGRNEAEVAAALGNPDRLARELRAEAGVKSWETARTPSLGRRRHHRHPRPRRPRHPGAAADPGRRHRHAESAIFSAAIGIFIAGGVVFAVGPFTGLPGGWAAALLGGLGLMAGAAAVGTLTTALTVWLVNGVVWYARLPLPRAQARPRRLKTREQ